MSRFFIVVAVTLCMQAPAFASDWVEDGDNPNAGMQQQQPQQQLPPALQEFQFPPPQQQPMMQQQQMQPGYGVPGMPYKKPKKSLLKRLAGDDDDDDDDDTMFGGMPFPATGGMRTTQIYNSPFASGTVTTEEEGFGAPMFAGTEVPVPTYGMVGGMPAFGTQYMGVPGMPGSQMMGAPGMVPYGGYGYGGGMGFGGGMGGYGGYGYPYGYGGSPLGYAVGGLLNRFAGPRNVYGYNPYGWAGGSNAFIGPQGNIVGGVQVPRR